MLDTIGYVLNNHIQQRQIKLEISYYSAGSDSNLSGNDYGVSSYPSMGIGGFSSRRELTGTLISADFDIEFNPETETIKRNCNISLYITDDVYDKIIVDNKILIVKVFCGINDEIWINKGYYAVSSENIIYDMSNKSISLTCQDLSCLLDGTLNGKIPAYTTVFHSGDDVVSAIKQTALLFGFYDFNIPDKIQYYNEDELVSTIPEDLTFPANTSAWDIVTQICNLNYGCLRYFDENGRFVVRGDLFSNDDTMFTYSDGALSTKYERYYNSSFNEIIISQNKNIDKSKIKNCIRIFGKDGIYHGDYIVNDIDNPFSVSNIGAIWEVYSGDIYDTITNDTQAEKWAKYIGNINTCSQNILECTAIEIPDFQVGAVIEMYFREEKRFNQCRISKIHYDFSNGIMNFSCYEIPKSLQIGGGLVLLPPDYNIVTNMMTMTINILSYMPSVNYNVYIDGILLTNFIGNSYTYTFNDTFSGLHTVTLQTFLYGDGSSISDSKNILLINNAILDNDNQPILDNDNQPIQDNN